MDKRMWSNEETEAFVGFMEEFVVDGTQPDNGQFSTGTFENLSLKMIERFPNCTLTTKHCKNKHKRMKEKYQYAADMLACNGFVEEEPDDDEPVFDDCFMSSTPTADGPAQTQGNSGNGTRSSVDHGASSRRLSRKKRKQVDILERMANEVHESTMAQREHIQILANAISGKNEEVKMGEKLGELGFADHEAIQAMIKICSYL
ncbi:hypothetical protein PIB30_099409 [Stylosanthes scabra]|uniref:Myb/SANT-like domain-containing protein n=1 Tax=Stylosanthes scabra TaxID=79078 RepID=A0ABU6QX43_9FABA|nr:hypothetical protein [Stylosanthes scabra]